MAARGFTLLELMVALVVMALAVVAVPILLSGGLAGMRLKADARDVADALREARGRAIMLNDEVVFAVDPETGRYTVTPGERAGVVAEGTALGVEPDSARGAVRFFPDGGSTGGRVTISRDRQHYDVSIDWLTGQVAIGE